MSFFAKFDFGNIYCAMVSAFGPIFPTVNTQSAVRVAIYAPHQGSPRELFLCSADSQFELHLYIHALLYVYRLSSAFSPGDIRDHKSGGRPWRFARFSPGVTLPLCLLRRKASMRSRQREVPERPCCYQPLKWTPYKLAERSECQGHIRRKHNLRFTTT